MHEHPLLMRPELVRATIAGRKTQTRRLVTPGTSTVDGAIAAQVWSDLDFARAMAVDHSLAERGIGADNHGRPNDGALVVPYLGQPFGRASATVRPRVRPGDSVYVREPWQTGSALDDEAPSMLAAWAATAGREPCGPVRYLADGTARDAHLLGPGSHYGEHWGRTRPGIHLPRWASRLVLEVVSVRVERVRDISEDDARAEGVTAPRHATFAFADMWDEINGQRPGASWAADPWVWVYEWPPVGVTTS